MEIIDSGLEGLEYVTMLSWIIQTYPGRELMSNPDLRIPPEKVRPLLDNSIVAMLEREYLEVRSQVRPKWFSVMQIAC